MKKYILISLWAITQIFHIAADYNSNKSNLEQQLRQIQSNFDTLNKLIQQKPIPNMEIYTISKQIKPELDSASNSIAQIKDLNLSPSQAQELEKLQSQFTQLQSWYRSHIIFKPLSAKP